ncbi:MAG: transcriptional regulator [archaeon]|nr:transcriptional regulator [archaeon]
MKPPCEIVVWYVIPAIRAELAKSLISYGMKQKDVSELLDITQPAVSQYTTSKRGKGIDLSDELLADIGDFAYKLYNGEAQKCDIISKTCSLCSKINTRDVANKVGLELSAQCQSCINCKK